MKLNEAAWQARYERQTELERVMMFKKRSEIGDARRELDMAKKRVSHVMTAILNHYRKHACNKD